MREQTRLRQKLSGRSAGILRAALVAIAVIGQVALVVFLVGILQERAFWVYLVIQVIAVIDIFILVGKRQNTSFTTAWVLLILLLPVTGHILYVLWGRRTKHRRMRRTLARTADELQKDPRVYQELGHAYPDRKRLAGYLGRMGFPVYRGTNCRYYELADEQFPAMIADIREAKRFVFLQYFILSDGVLWREIRELLAQKVAEGVEVRLMCDDLGSLLGAPAGIDEDLRNLGISFVRFNPIHYSISRLYMNYRNHQKMAIIDGEIAYTGGANLADEYINLYEKFGHWKDTAIRLEGDAVWSMTVFFLQMWESQTKQEECFDAYRGERREMKVSPGFYQPFMDGPMNNPDNPAEIMYRSMIYNAHDYLYITTPYLVIDKSMVDALCTAALGGTDVRIITPHAWDKWFVHMATQSTYTTLLRAGVRIYEYLPGYIHAKSILSDDEHCIMGTINMDYRSFYLHYENGVWICGSPIVRKMKKDFLEILEQSKEIEREAWKNRAVYWKVVQGFFRIFAIFF